MKRLYIAFPLIVLAVFICLYSSNIVEKSSSRMREELHEIGTLIYEDKTDEAERSLERTKETWKKSETLFSFIVDADKIEEMNVDFSMIIAHLKDGNKEHALERLRECELLLDEINENEKLNIKNIM